MVPENRRIKQQGMTQNICYFSKKCRFCQGFLEELSKTPFFKEVKFVCVDPSPSRGPLPAWLKVVPTMILANGEENLVGPQAVNNWLFSRKLLQNSGSGSGSGETKGNAFKERSEPIRVPEYSPNVPTRPTPAPKHDSGSHPTSAPSDGTEPLAWHDAEMAGGNWSDSYSFVDDSFTAEKGMNRIIRNFESLGGGPVGGAPVGGGGSGKPQQQRSAKEDKLLREFEAFSKMRDMEFTAPKRMG
jgi:hypothetical protein